MYIHSKLAEFFVRCTIPFKVVDSEAFRNFVQVLRPAFADDYLCDKDKLRTLVLQESYSSMYEKVTSKIKQSKYFSIILYHWNCVDGSHLLNMMIHTPENSPFFYKTINVSADSLTKEKISDLIIKTAKELDNNTFIGVLMDNTQADPGAKKLIEEKYPNIFANGCVTHHYNLIMNDICKEKNAPKIKNLLNECIQLVELANSHQDVANTLKRASKKLEMHNETRFSTNISMVRSVLENENLLRFYLAGNHRDLIKSPNTTDEVKNEIMKIVDNNDFWVNLKVFFNILEPVEKYLVISEQKHVFIETVYADHLCLYNHFKTVELNGLIQREKLMAIFVHHWIHFHSSSMGYAYILNPKKIGKPMMKYKDEFGRNYDDYTDTLKQLKSHIIDFYKKDVEKASKAQRELEKFSIEFVNAKDEYIEENASENPRAYWCMQGKQKYPCLAEIADRIMHLIVSEISSERVSKMYGYIYSNKNTSRLTAEQIEKLAFIYLNTILIDDKDKEDYLPSGELF